jgi:hypothetical protein
MDTFDRLVIERAHSILVADAQIPGSEELSNVHNAWKVLSSFVSLVNTTIKRTLSQGGEVVSRTDGLQIAPAVTGTAEVIDAHLTKGTQVVSPLTPCAEKQSLREAFVEAVQEMMLLQKEQIKAIMEDDPDFMRFDLLLHMAAEKKHRAKYAFVHHVEDHGCQETVAKNDYSASESDTKGSATAS